jgi:hypothetical protein
MAWPGREGDPGQPEPLVNELEVECDELSGVMVPV